MLSPNAQNTLEGLKKSFKPLKEKKKKKLHIKVIWIAP